jgi:uroporphyrin-III C-methyltransferase/precorrin-2 dehydrogenase/sirohydrochlorin ferrochelatase
MNVRLQTDLPIARMPRLARLPVFLALDGRRVVIAGGRPAAAWKAELLAASGASVDVFGAGFCEELAALGARTAERGAITLHARTWRPEDIAGAAVAIGDFADAEGAAAFARAARAAGVLVNVIDKPAYCDFSFGAIVNRSPLIIGISTDGAAPAFAQAMRTRLETLIPRGFARWASAAQRWRVRLGTYRLSSNVRRRFWQKFAAFAMAEPEREPQARDFAELLDQTVRDEAAAGSITVISPVPCDPELLTLRAIRALAGADVLLLDGDIVPGVLEFARREAERISLRGLSQSEVAAKMSRLASHGNRVVVLSGTKCGINGQTSSTRALRLAAAAKRRSRVSSGASSASASAT